MGSNSQKQKFKKYVIPVNKRLFDIIDNINKKEKNDERKNLFHKNIEKNIKLKNISKNYIKKEKAFKNICSFLDYIYKENTNYRINISLYETIFNYDIIDRKEKENEKVREKINKMLPDFSGNKLENEKINISNIEELYFESIKLDKKNNEDELNKINSFLNKSPKKKIEKFEEKKKKKHKKISKLKPVAIVKMNFNDVKKEVYLEQIYNDKNKLNSHSQINILKNDFIKLNFNNNNENNIDSKHFLKLFDNLIQPNKLEKDQIHNHKKKMKIQKK